MPAPISTRRRKSSSSASPKRSFAEIAAEVYRRMQPHGIIAEYKSLGVRFTAAEPRENGALECFSVYHKEDSPSAYVNVNTGKYGDSSGGGNAREVDIWQVAADLGKIGTDWKEIREAYADKVGESFKNGGRSKGKSSATAATTTTAEGSATSSRLTGEEGASSADPTSKPAGRQSEDWRDCLAFVDWNAGQNFFLQCWCKLHRPGISPAAFKASGGRYAIYTSAASRRPRDGETEPRAGHSIHVLCIPVYGPELLAADPVGWIMWQKNGQEFIVGEKNDAGEYQTAKMKVCGSAGGVVGLHGLKALADDKALTAAGQPTTIARIWKVEGPTDLLSLLSAILSPFPQADLPAALAAAATTPILSMAGGAKQCARWMAALFSGHETYLIHDADPTGEIGAVKCCEMIGPVVPLIKHVRLPFPIAEKHGPDLRDYFLSGKSYDDVCGLELWCDPFVVTEAHREAAAKGLAGEGETSESDGVDADDASDSEASSTSAADPLSIRYITGRTETAFAARFVRSLNSTILFCAPWNQWLYWDGKRWKKDTGLHINALATTFAVSLWEEIATITGSDDYLAELASTVKRQNSAAAIANLITLARSEPGVPVQPDQFDAHPWLLNVENGILNLANGELSPHDPSKFLTKLAPVHYNPDATSPTWLKFLADVTAPADGDPATLEESTSDTLTISEYLRRLAGYTLTGDVREHVMPFLFGSGANGKSTFLNILLDLLGPDYAMKAAPELLMARGGESHPTERADLFGMRLVITNEIEEGRRLSESLVKDITGGDAIRARRMREDFWQFKPTHKIIMAGNHKPIVKGNDEGIWRRIKLIPFTANFKGRADKELPDKLRAELSGILNWALAGCREWLDEGLSDPQAIIDATAEYRGESDVLGNFIAERCEVGESWHRVRASSLYADYRKWCESIGEREMSQKRFGSLLLNDGRFQRKESHGIWYLGICLRDDDPRENDLPRSSPPLSGRPSTYTQQNFN